MILCICVLSVVISPFLISNFIDLIFLSLLLDESTLSLSPPLGVSRKQIKYLLFCGNSYFLLKILDSQWSHTVACLRSSGETFSRFPAEDRQMQKRGDIVCCIVARKWASSLSTEWAIKSGLRRQWFKEPGGLQCLGSQRVQHNWSSSARHKETVRSQMTARLPGVKPWICHSHLYLTSVGLRFLICRIRLKWWIESTS